MRIISGTYRSRALVAPAGEHTRPTSDRARETVFNMLANLVDFDGSNVLDLFAGSGAFAFEALSRGAAKVTCVDRTKDAIEALRKNASSLFCESQTRIIRSDAYLWIPQAIDSYDVVFADPPYDDPRALTDLPRLIFGSRLLTPDSIVIIEHRSGSEIVVPSGVSVIKSRKASLAQFTFLQRIDQRSDEADNEKGDLSGDVRSDHERAS